MKRRDFELCIAFGVMSILNIVSGYFLNFRIGYFMGLMGGLSIAVIIYVNRRDLKAALAKPITDDNRGALSE